jgi:selenophosphate synthase
MFVEPKCSDIHLTQYSHGAGYGHSVCHAADISLAGGHSIGVQEGELLFLSKPLGIGIVITAEKKVCCRLSTKS